MKSVLFAGLAVLALGGCAATPGSPSGSEQLVTADGESCPPDAKRQTPPRSATLALTRNGALPVAFGCRTRGDWARIAEIKRNYDRCVAEATVPGGQGEQYCRYRPAFY